jgi:hypothetical protein
MDRTVGLIGGIFEHWSEESPLEPEQPFDSGVAAQYGAIVTQIDGGKASGGGDFRQVSITFDGRQQIEHGAYLGCA